MRLEQQLKHVFFYFYGNRAPPVLENGLCLFAAPIVRRVSQQLAHDFSKYNEKSCSAYSE